MRGEYLFKADGALCQGFKFWIEFLKIINLVYYIIFFEKYSKKKKKKTETKSKLIADQEKTALLMHY